MEFHIEAPLQLEPIDQLAPYLQNLQDGDLNETLEALADLVLAPARFSSPSYAPSSPGGASEASSVNCCASCTSRWRPAASSSAGSSSCGDEYSSWRSSSTSGGDSTRRRQKNATAAERYRKKVKGRRSKLGEELEREQLRNAKLRRTLEAKLVLYREFASLLAQNTSDHERDLELAQLGSQSIGNILVNANDAQLRQLQLHFASILRNRPSSQEFEYSF